MPLSHVYYEDKLYNGFPASSVTSLGAYHCGIDKVDGKGITSRGVLLDIVRLRGVETFCELGDPITAAELDEAARKQGVTVERGDIVLVRTGWWARFLETGDGAEPGAGLDWTCASWLHDHEVAAVAADNLMVENPILGCRRCLTADAHAVPARHGSDARRILGSQPHWRRTARPTASTNSSSSHRP